MPKAEFSVEIRYVENEANGCPKVVPGDDSIARDIRKAERVLAALLVKIEDAPDPGADLDALKANETVTRSLISALEGLRASITELQSAGLVKTRSFTLTRPGFAEIRAAEDRCHKESAESSIPRSQASVIEFLLLDNVKGMTRTQCGELEGDIAFALASALGPAVYPQMDDVLSQIRDK